MLKTDPVAPRRRPGVVPIRTLQSYKNHHMYPTTQQVTPAETGLTMDAVLAAFGGHQTVMSHQGTKSLSGSSFGNTSKNSNKNQGKRLFVCEKRPNQLPRLSGSEMRKSQTGFVRLNSLDGECATTPEASAPESRLPFGPTKTESKWFGSYSSSQSSYPNCHPEAAAAGLCCNPAVAREFWYKDLGETQSHCDFFPAGFSHPPPPLPEQYLGAPIASAGLVLHQSLPEEMSAAAVCGFVDGVIGSFTSRAISNLNPNARSFTPLNPYAKEFKPATKVAPAFSAPATSQSNAAPTVQRTDSTEVSAQAASLSASPCHDSVTESSEENVIAEQKSSPEAAVGSANGSPDSLSKCLPAVSPSDSEVAVSESVSNVGTISPVKRLRSLSSCSSDDSYIEFASSHEDEGDHDRMGETERRRSKSLNKKALQPSLYAPTDSEEDDDDGDEDDDEEKDDDDDDDDSSSSSCCSSDEEDWDYDCDPGRATLVDIPLELQNCGLVCPLQLGSSSSKKKSQHPVDRQEERAGSDDDDCYFFSSAQPGLEQFPSSAKKRDEAAAANLKEANVRWNNFYRSHSSDVGSPIPRVSVVQFTDSKHWDFISEDPLLSEALRAARKSNVAEKRADQARMERLLAPVLDKEHRQRVYERLHANQN